MNRWTVGLVVAVSVGVSFWFVRRAPAASVAPARAAPPAGHETVIGLAATNSDVAVLQAQLAQLRGRLHECLAEKAKAPVVENSPSASSDEPPAEVPPETPEEADARHRSDMESTFSHDRPPPSVREASDLRERLKPHLAVGSSVRSLECRATMCRLETAHPNRAQYSEFVEKTFASVEAIKDPLWRGRTTFSMVDEPEDPAAPVVGVAYMQRRVDAPQ